MQQILDQRAFALEQMRRSRHIDEYSIGRIGCDERRIHRAPVAEPHQCIGILCRICVENRQVGHERLRVRDRHAARQAQRQRRIVHARDDAALTVDGRENQRLIPRRRGTILPPQPIGRPAWQEDGDYPPHRKPPRSMNAVRRP